MSYNIAFDATLIREGGMHGIARVEGQLLQGLTGEIGEVAGIKIIETCYHAKRKRFSFLRKTGECDAENSQKKFWTAFLNTTKRFIKSLWRNLRFVAAVLTYFVIILAWRSRKKAQKAAILAMYIKFFDVLFPPCKWLLQLAINLKKTGNKIALDVARGAMQRSPHSRQRGDIFDFSGIDAYMTVGCAWDRNDLARVAKFKAKKGFKLIVMVHDIIPLTLPHLCRSHGFEQYIYNVVWHADLIFCISNYTKQSLLDYSQGCGGPDISGKITVTGVGADLSPDTSIDTATGISGGNKNPENSSKYSFLPKNGYAIFVSTIEVRKNHALLVRLWTELILRGEKVIPLVFVGKVGWDIDDLISCTQRNPELMKHIHILQSVSDADLVMLYKNARFALFPSLAEGWGLGVSEAMLQGTPVISASGSSMPEVGGGCTELIDTLDGKKWYETIVRYINDDAFIEERRRFVREQYKPVLWADVQKTVAQSVAALLQGHLK